MIFVLLWLDVMKVLREIYPPDLEKLGVIVLEFQLENARLT
jgi:hypothetical protein